jgi:hypothetical protein
MPPLRGYVCTTPKGRAEVPIVSDKGDPVLAHWQYGLGRAVAFTSDAKAKWAAEWLGWAKYRQFWAQIAQWSLRRLDTGEFTTEVSVEKGEGVISVEAVDAEGNYRNFLNLQAVVVGPKGDKQTVRPEQTGPGRYEARFAARQVGAYLINLLEIKDGKVRASQALGASVNYSPEFNTAEPNQHLLTRVAQGGGGKLLELSERRTAANNPFLHDRLKTYQPRDLWEWLLKLAVLLFTVDVGVRRIYLDRSEWLKATENLRRWLFFWRGPPRPAEAEESLAALLARRDRVRGQRTGMGAAGEPRPELFQPAAGATVALPGAGAPAEAAPTAAEAAAAAPPPAPDRASTTGRLLEAKRRAMKRLDKQAGESPKPRE